MRYGYLALLGVIAMAGCGRAAPPITPAGNCIGLADDLKTLQVGDELPRVVQVLGMPKRSFRAYSPFGRSYDVLEYPVQPSPCMRAVLHVNDKLQIVFDGHGQYVGYGDEAFMRFRRATTVRVEPLVIDPVVFRP